MRCASPGAARKAGTKMVKSAARRHAEAPRAARCVAHWLIAMRAAKRSSAIHKPSMQSAPVREAPFRARSLRTFPKTFTVPTSSANEAIFLHGLWGRWGPTSWVSPIAADLVVASYRMPVEPDPEPAVDGRGRTLTCVDFVSPGKPKKRRHPRWALWAKGQQSRHGCRGVEGILGSRVRREPSHITSWRRPRALGFSPARGQAPEGQCSLDSGACGVT